MNGKGGLYLHIPFCFSKCPYCDFFSIKYEEALARRYVNRLIREMQNYQGEFDTVYFGGGTPSILPPDFIGKITQAAKKHFDIDESAEITVECNPSENLQEKLFAYKEYGVNRISIGMQSARNEERFALGRRASVADIVRVIHWARSAGIENISLDLMLGTPKQTLESLDETFEFIDKMQVTHISAYMLKLEKHTKFYEIRDRLTLPDEDTVCDMYLKTVDELKRLGFHQYEISNFSKLGFESRHNLKYWQLDEYLGLGPSAHSFWHGKRFYYDENFNKTDEGIGGTTEEKIMLGLRLNRGVDKSLIHKDYSLYLQSGLMKEQNGRVFLTPQGMLVSNIIIGVLI